MATLAGSADRYLRHVAYPHAWLVGISEGSEAGIAALREVAEHYRQAPRHRPSGSSRRSRTRTRRNWTARASAEALRRQASESEPLLRADHQIGGLIALEGNDVSRAMEQLGKADPDDSMTKALLAECQKKLRQREEARALRDEILSGSQVSFGDPIA